MSSDPEGYPKAYAQLAALGLEPIALMSEAYLDRSAPSFRHDLKIQELERRRREVKRDFDALQKTRPVDVESVAVEDMRR